MGGGGGGGAPDPVTTTVTNYEGAGPPPIPTPMMYFKISLYGISRPVTLLCLPKLNIVLTGS